MSPLVKITGVGAHVPAAKGGRSRMVGHGATVTVDDGTAKRMVKSGVAVLVGGDVAAEQAVTADPAGAVDPASLSVAKLKALVKSKGLTVGQARTKDALLALLAQAPADTVPDGSPDGEAGEDEVVVPEDLGELDDEALLALAVKLEVEVPEGTDRDALIDLLEDHVDDEDGEG